ncbi:MAG: addiction module antidote protein [Pseudomonadota bacterium]
MSTPHRTHDEATTEMFRNDPNLAIAYLNSVLADGDDLDVMLALRSLSAAFGGVSAIARHADANVNTMYRTLSKHGNPSLRTLRGVLDAMGMRLAVQAAEKPKFGDGIKLVPQRPDTKVVTEEIAKRLHGESDT